MKKIIVVTLTILFVFFYGLHLGRTAAIHQAELLDINDTEYTISFGDEVHIYDKGE